MATSGTATFNIDAIELIEEAYERVTDEPRSGYDMRTARRSLDLLALEWQNRGINLWTVEQREMPLIAGQASYTLEADIIDLLESITREGVGTQQIDYQMTRISVSTYATRSNKLVEARPTEIYVDRQRDAPVVTMWPVPQHSNYVLVYWVMRRIEDVGAYTNTADVSARFLPAMAAGLSYQLGLKEPKLPLERLLMLEGNYEKQFDLAAGEDRDKASLNVVPAVARVV